MLRSCLRFPSTKPGPAPYSAPPPITAQNRRAASSTNAPMSGHSAVSSTKHLPAAGQSRARRCRISWPVSSSTNRSWMRCRRTFRPISGPLYDAACIRTESSGCVMSAARGSRSTRPSANGERQGRPIPLGASHGDLHLWKMPAAGGEAQRLTKGTDRIRHMFYSSDGRWLYFQPSHLHIYRMPADGRSRPASYPLPGGRPLPRRAGDIA